MAIVDGLVTLAEARAALGWAATDTSNDSQLERYVEAATPLVEFHTGPLIQRSRVFTFDGGSSTIVVPVRFASVTSIVESGVTITDVVTDLQAATITAGTTDGVRDFAYGYQNVVVTVAVGVATIPENVKLATLVAVTLWWQQNKQANTPAFGGAADAAPVPMGFALPKRSLEHLEPTKRIAGFA